MVLGFICVRARNRCQTIGRLCCVRENLATSSMTLPVKRKVMICLVCIFYLLVMAVKFIIKQIKHNFFNHSNAGATFVQSKRRQRFLEII